jgi:hypothetical protein
LHLHFVHFLYRHVESTGTDIRGHRSLEICSPASEPGTITGPEEIQQQVTKGIFVLPLVERITNDPTAEHVRVVLSRGVKTWYSVSPWASKTPCLMVATQAVTTQRSSITESCLFGHTSRIGSQRPMRSRRRWTARTLRDRGNLL